MGRISRLACIGEIFAATRADLVLPSDVQRTIGYLLLALGRGPRFGGGAVAQCRHHGYMYIYIHIFKQSPRCSSSPNSIAMLREKHLRSCGSSLRCWIRPKSTRNAATRRERGFPCLPSARLLARTVWIKWVEARSADAHREQRKT